MSKNDVVVVDAINKKKRRNRKPKKEQKVEREIKAIKETLPKLGKHVGQLIATDSYRKGNNLRSTELQTKGGGPAARVMRMLAAPMQNDPVRFSGDFTADKTSLSSPWDVIDVPWDVTNDANKEFSFFLFRDPLRALVFYDVNSTTKETQYDFYMIDKDGTSTLTPTYTSYREEIGEYLPMQWNYAQYHDNGDHWKPHGSFIYPGKDNVRNSDLYFIWLDVDTAVNFAATATGTAGQAIWSIRAWKWDNGQLDAIDGVVTITSGAPDQGTFDIHESAYYGFEMGLSHCDISSSDITFSLIKYTADVPVFCHQDLPDMDENIGSAEGIRTLAATGLYTNTSPTLADGGKITGFQFKNTEAWYDVATFDEMAKRNDAYNGKAKDGIYGFLRPSDEKDFERSKSYRLKNGVLANVGYPLMPEGDYLGFCVSIDKKEDRSGRITLSFALDFSTTDTWRPISADRIDPKIFKDAILATARLPQFHENPLHLKDIFAFIKKAANKVVEYGPQAMNIARMVSGMIK